MSGSTLQKHEIVEVPFDELMHQCKLAEEAHEKVWILDCAQVLSPPVFDFFGIDWRTTQLPVMVAVEHVDQIGMHWSCAQRKSVMNKELDPPRIFAIINWKAAEHPWYKDRIAWCRNQVRIWEPYFETGRYYVGGVDVRTMLKRAQDELAKLEPKRDRAFEDFVKKFYIRPDTTVALVDHVDLRPLHERHT
jgi:hypothetical protein